MPYKDKEKKRLHDKEYMKNYNIKNRDRLREYQKQWRKNNPGKVKQCKKQWRKNNPEREKKYNDNSKEYKRQWHLDNLEKMKKYMKQWYENNREIALKKSKQWRENHPEKMKGYHKRYYENNLEKVKERSRQWYKNNHRKATEWGRQYCKNRYETDLKYNLNNKIKAIIRLSLRGGKAGRKWEDLVGYTLEDLYKRLRKTMPIDYTWQDFMDSKLHIDHIIPISAFNFTKPEHIDFKRCWALKNLRLLPAKENLIKSNKLIKPFQLALKI